MCILCESAWNVWESAWILPKSESLSMRLSFSNDGLWTICPVVFLLALCCCRGPRWLGPGREPEALLNLENLCAVLCGDGLFEERYYPLKVQSKYIG